MATRPRRWFTGPIIIFTLLFAASSFVTALVLNARLTAQQREDACEYRAEAYETDVFIIGHVARRLGADAERVQLEQEFFRAARPRPACG